MLHPLAIKHLYCIIIIVIIITIIIIPTTINTIIITTKGHVEEVERVSIIPRGNTWAATIFKREPDEFYTYTTREMLLEKIAVLLAGNRFVTQRLK